MTGTPADSIDPTDDLEPYRPYPLALARARGRLAAGAARIDLDPSDVVQQTMLAAHAHRGEFRGGSIEERKGWLRAILIRQILDAGRRRSRRPEGRARSIERSMEESSRRPDAWLVADGPSPSMEVRRGEHAPRLAAALVDLPEDQRAAPSMHDLDGSSVSEVAAALGRTPASVAGLVRRGLRQLREAPAEMSEGRPS